LAGTWSGTFAPTGAPSQTPVTWTATQSGSNATGAFVVLVGSAKTPITGTLAGAISGTQVSLTMTVPAGAFAVLGSATCSLTGAGTAANASTSSLVATITLTYAPVCAGTITDPGVTSEVKQLSLSK
jgi:hypothetical protein